MRYSHLLGKTKKNPPNDADTVNAKLLVQGGFVDQLAAGIYSYLPLGVRVLHKIMRIIREEMGKVGGQEVYMPVLHPAENWEATGRDESCSDILYQTIGHGERKYFMGQSHEEIVTPLVQKFVNSYKDLPFAPFQIQVKFRNEARAKSGVLRGREFLMKDMYSFHTDEEDLDRYYQLVIEAYLRIFERCGVEAFVVKASGGTFTDKESDEFQVLTDAGEDLIYYHPGEKQGYNEEILENHRELKPEEMSKGKSVEVGNIFKLGDKFARDFDLKYADGEGGLKYPVMGCYGIGVSRLMGAIVEASHDENGIVWPRNVAPFDVQMVTLGRAEEVERMGSELYEKMMKAGYEVLWDDRDERAGAKFKDADLIGCPVRIVLSERTMAENKVEWKLRKSEEVKMIEIGGLIEELSFLDD